MHAQKRQTNQPKKKETDHSRCINALRDRYAVLQRQEARPDSSNHDSYRIRTVHILNGEPEDGENGTRHDGDVGAPETPGSACDDWEGDVVDYADGTVQSDDEGDYEEGEGDYAEGFAPCETCCRCVSICGVVMSFGGLTDRNNGGCELPCCSASKSLEATGEVWIVLVTNLKASDTQYEMKLVTPHFRACLGTGSRSLFVLCNISVIRPSPLQDHLPSCIALRESRFGLLDLERPVRLLDDRHLDLQQACRTMSEWGGVGSEVLCLYLAAGHTRLFIPAAQRGADLRRRIQSMSKRTVIR
jgi:hypothetical protein